MCKRRNLNCPFQKLFLEIVRNLDTYRNRKKVKYDNPKSWADDYKNMYLMYNQNSLKW